MKCFKENRLLWPIPIPFRGFGRMDRNLWKGYLLDESILALVVTLVNWEGINSIPFRQGKYIGFRHCGKTGIYAILLYPLAGYPAGEMK